MNSPFLHNYCSNYENTCYNYNKFWRKRKCVTTDVNESPKRMFRNEVLKQEDTIDEMCDRINYVPFPQQPKTNGVVIEEIKEDKIDENLEVVSSQTSEVQYVISGLC